MGKFVLYFIIMIKVLWCGFTGYYTLDVVGSFNSRGIFFLCQVVFQLLLLLLKLLSLLLLLVNCTCFLLCSDPDVETTPWL